MKKIIAVLIILTTMLTLFNISLISVNAQSDLSTFAQDRLKNAVVLYVGSSDAYVNNTKEQIDESNPDITAISKKNRTLVPIRFISESLGAKVSWNDKISTVNIELNNKTLKLVIGSKKMNIGDKICNLEAPAEKINNRAYIPLRAVAEAFGKKIFYDRGLIIISGNDKLFDAKNDKVVLDEIIEKINNLPVVGSKERLEDLLSSSNSYYYGEMNYATDLDVSMARSSSSLSQIPNMFSKSSSLASSASSDEDYSRAVSSDMGYSKTNVQVEGVDEADVIKSDGKYIYQVKGSKVIISEVYPANNMKIAAQIDVKDKKLTPTEIYADGKYLVVIGRTHVETVERWDFSLTEAVTPRLYSRIFTEAVVYDISDKSNIKELRELAVEGDYLSSRKIGSSFYMLTNKYVSYYSVRGGDQYITPQYKDSILGDKLKSIDYKQIQYFPGCEFSNYMVVSAVDLSDSSKEANIYTYLGSGQNMYVSQGNLYAAETKYNRSVRTDKTTSIYEESTRVYKFSLNDSKITYLYKGEVPGRILNQFSMDENGEYFRIATTKGQTWGSGDATSKNNVYILNDTMSIAGKLENLAPGERIYSVRFVGEKAYVVTFRQVDPLFVIDLTPENPKVLGALKIPGYSEYLHPYDENHIIGFGRDTTVTKDGNTVRMNGLKMALFDVTDVAKPKELFKELIGDMGADSELLRNHKALLFSKEKNLLAFPVTAVKYSFNGEASGFMGAYIYSIDLKEGFKLRKQVTHYDDDKSLKTGYIWYNSNSNNIERILYIKDALYTLSQSKIKAFDMKELNEIGTLIVQ